MRSAEPAENPSETVLALRRLLEALAQDRRTIGDLADALGRSGQSLVLALLALPSFLPIPGLPTGLVFGTGMIVVAWRILRDDGDLALPVWLRRRALPAQATRATAARLERWAGGLGRLFRPRAPALTGPAATRAAAMIVLLMGALIVAPIPTGNQGPSLAVMVLAAALAERDGVAMIAGVVLAALGLAWNIGLVLLGGEAASRLLQIFG